MLNPSPGTKVQTDVSSFKGYIGTVVRVVRSGQEKRRIDIWVRFENHPWGNNAYAFTPNELRAAPSAATLGGEDA